MVKSARMRAAWETKTGRSMARCASAVAWRSRASRSYLWEGDSVSFWLIADLSPLALDLDGPRGAAVTWWTKVRMTSSTSRTGNTERFQVAWCSMAHTHDAQVCIDDRPRS